MSDISNLEPIITYQVANLRDYSVNEFARQLFFLSGYKEQQRRICNVRQWGKPEDEIYFSHLVLLLQDADGNPDPKSMNNVEILQASEFEIRFRGVAMSTHEGASYIVNVYNPKSKVNKKSIQRLEKRITRAHDKAIEKLRK